MNKIVATHSAVAVAALAFLSGCNTSSRPCSGPMVITREQDLAQVRNCNVIAGDLRIEQSSLTKLDGLESISRVDNLVIANNPALKSIEGLRGLSVANGITVMANPFLSGLHGLEGIRTAEGVMLSGNGLTTVEGLSGLTRVDELTIVDEPALTGLSGIRNAQIRTVDVERCPLAGGVHGSTVTSMK